MVRQPNLRQTPPLAELQLLRHPPLPPLSTLLHGSKWVYSIMRCIEPSTNQGFVNNISAASAAEGEILDQIHTLTIVATACQRHSRQAKTHDWPT